MPLFVTVTPGTTITPTTTLSASTLNLLGTPSVDVTGSVDGGTLSVADGSLSLSKFQSINGNRLIGNGNSVAAYPAELSSTDLTFTSTTVNVASNAITTAKLNARAVTAEKLFAVDGTTTAKLLGRYTTGSGDVETLTIGSNLTVAGGTLNTIRPGIVFTNVEAISSYTLPTSRASAVEISALTTSITPQSATSKILVQFNFSCEIQNTASGSQIKQAFILERVVGGSPTPLGVPSTPGSRIYGTKVMPYDANDQTTQSNIVISFVDSPATTSAVTYRVKAYTGPASGTSQTMFLNGTINQTDADYNTRSTSQVILQEILV